LEYVIRGLVCRTIWFIASCKPTGNEAGGELRWRDLHLHASAAQVPYCKKFWRD
jgi:hypothetical protein